MGRLLGRAIHWELVTLVNQIHLVTNYLISESREKPQPPRSSVMSMIDYVQLTLTTRVVILMARN